MKIRMEYQLYRKSCDGIHSEQLTRSRLGCRMPAMRPEWREARLCGTDGSWDCVVHL